VINADENTCPFDGAGNDSPTPEKPDTPENPESGACEDGHKACSSKKHICGNDMYAPMMVSKCPKTCNACEAATHGPNSSAKCKDTSFMCARKSIKDACDKVSIYRYKVISASIY
jgi:hypothetical protein